MRDTSVRLAKLSLAGLLVGTLLMQILLPVFARQTGESFEEARALVVPYSIASVLAIASIQVVIIAVWLLVSSIPKGAFFGGTRSATLIDVIRTAVVVAAAIPAIIAFHLLFVVGVGGPGVVLGLLATCVMGAAFTALLTLGKRLYLNAAAEHEELSSVV